MDELENLTYNDLAKTGIVLLLKKIKKKSNELLRENITQLLTKWQEKYGRHKNSKKSNKNEIKSPEKAKNSESKKDIKSSEKEKVPDSQSKQKELSPNKEEIKKKDLNYLMNINYHNQEILQGITFIMLLWRM